MAATVAVHEELSMSGETPVEARDPDIEVDAVGMPCPMPVIELSKAVASAPVGALVRVRADDPAAKVDVPVWCRMQRQRLVSQRVMDTVYVFDVHKVRETDDAERGI